MRSNEVLLQMPADAKVDAWRGPVSTRLLYQRGDKIGLFKCILNRHCEVEMRMAMDGQRARVQPCFVACGAQRRITRSLRRQPRRRDAGEKSWARKSTCDSIQELNSIGS